MKNNTMIMIIGAVVIAAVAFFAGMQYQKSQAGGPNGTRQFAGANGQGGFGRRFGANGGAVFGDIIASDDKSITVKLTDGSSKIVLVTSAATINKAATGTKDDLKTGVRVAVFGTTNSDGSVTAQNIQINPMMRGMPRPTGQ